MDDDDWAIISDINETNAMPDTAKSPGDGRLEINVEHCNVLSAKELTYYSSDYDVEHAYRNFTIPKGHAMIINNHTFEKLDAREGTDVDEINMRQLLLKLGYNVIDTRRNRTAEQMMLDAIEFAKNPGHAFGDSCIVVVLSHGENGTLSGVDDKVHGKTGSLSVKAFLKYFEPKHAPDLAGKPKIFFIQACRGNDHDKGHYVRDSALDGPCASKPDKTAILQAQVPVLSTSEQLKLIPVGCDFLVSYSTPADHVSWRCPIKGSWFIRTICKVFSSRARHEPITGMLTKVNKFVGERVTAEGDKQCTEFKHSLRRDFYFFPGVSIEEPMVGRIPGFETGIGQMVTDVSEGANRSVMMVNEDDHPIQFEFHQREESRGKHMIHPGQWLRVDFVPHVRTHWRCNAWFNGTHQPPMNFDVWKEHGNSKRYIVRKRDGVYEAEIDGSGEHVYFNFSFQ